MEEFRGYVIEVIDNNEKEYPYKAIGRKEEHEIKHKGHSRQEAIDHVKEVINFTLSKVEMKNTKKFVVNESTAPIS